MKYLLDTDILIDLIKKENKIEEKVKDVGLVNCYVSEITIAELNFGAYHSGKIKKHRDESEHISNTFGVVPISEVLDLFGREKSRLFKLGNPIPDFDLLIATTAVYYNYTLVTGNVKHHSRVKDIRIENWRLEKFNTNLVI